MNRRELLKLAAVSPAALLLNEKKDYYVRQTLFEAEPTVLGYWLDDAPPWQPADWLTDVKHSPYVERRRRLFLYERYAGILWHNGTPRAWGEIEVTERFRPILQRLPKRCSESCLCWVLPDTSDSWLVKATATSRSVVLPTVPYDWRRWKIPRQPCRYCGSDEAFAFCHDYEKNKALVGFTCQPCRIKVCPITRSMMGLT